MVSAMLGVCYNIFLAPYPYPNPYPLPTTSPPLPERSSVLPTDMTTSTNVNSQLFASISSSSKVGAGDPFLGAT